MIFKFFESFVAFIECQSCISQFALSYRIAPVMRPRSRKRPRGPRPRLSCPLVTDAPGVSSVIRREVDLDYSRKATNGYGRTPISILQPIRGHRTNGAAALFVAQSFHRVETRRLHCRPDPEEHSHGDRDAEARHHRP